MRPLAMIRHLLRPLLGDAERIDIFLNALTATKQYGCLLLEGGALWFNRAVRNYLYRENTKHLGTTPIGRLLDNAEPPKQGAQQPDDWNVDLRNTIVQLLITYVVHFRLSRTYYVYNFCQSHDAFAFLAYTYHRVSGLRYLTKLIAVVDKWKAREAAQYIRNGFVSAGMFLSQAAEPAGPSGLKELLLRFRIHPETELRKAMYGENACGVWQRLLMELKDRHHKELLSLQRAWERHEVQLRRQIPAQQLLHWCDQLIQDDVPNRCCRVVIGYKKGEARYYPSTNRLVDPPSLEALLFTLQDLRVKLWIERGDYESVLHARYQQLHLDFPASPTANKQLNPPAFQEFFEQIATRGDLSIDHLHWLLDVANCITKTHQDQEDVIYEAAPLLRSIRCRLDALGPHIDAMRRGQRPPNPKKGVKGHRQALLKGRLSDESFASFCADYQEAVLRHRHLSAANLLGNVSVFASGRIETYLDESEPDEEVETMNSVLALVDEGLEQNRLQDNYVGRPPRSVVIDRTPDGTLYSQYRAIFDSLRARAHWRRRWHELRRDNKNYYTSDGDPDLRGCFEAAFRYLDLAKGGLEATNPLLAALTEMYAAEACLALGRIQLLRARKASVQEQPDRNRVQALVNETVAKHESARGSLQRAKERLANSRRNAIWWRLFFALVAQYQADRLGVHYLQMLLATGANDPINATTADYLSRLRKGFNAIRNAVDFQMPVSTLLHDSWLRTIWAEAALAGAGLAIGIVIGDVKDDRIPKDAVVKTVLSIIWSVSASERLPTSATVVMLEKSLRDAVVRLYSDYKLYARSHSKELSRAFDLRSHVMNCDPSTGTAWPKYPD